ncbi:caspase family protein [Micromonospora sp. WMMD987]|uniref:caspase family protein n=1 Tax=Micromonospora sp. WMMD987 TaxID=3016089 RepID=UPI002499E74F|nr:caspase family protein [Micromonospora sp. WMMD987]WFE97527.1 caspase family protein [Micromonospora sp. WMMD987]
MKHAVVTEGLAMLDDIRALRYPSVGEFDALLQRLAVAQREAIGAGDYQIAFLLEDCATELGGHRPDIESAAEVRAARAVQRKAHEILRASRDGRPPTTDDLEGTIHRLRSAGAAMLAVQHFMLAAELADLRADLGRLTALTDDEVPPTATVIHSRLPRAEDSVAVLIGSAEYASSDIVDLTGVRNNLSDLSQILGDHDHGGFDPARIHQILNPDLTAARRVAALSAEVTDTLVVYFAGHGTVGPDGELYLALPESTPGYEHFDGLPYAKIRQAILDSPARQRVVILDCCFSGRAIDAMGSSTALLDMAGTYILTSTSAVRPSYAPAGERNTTFTGALLEVMRHGVDNGESLLRVTEMYRPVWRHLRRLGRPAPEQRLTGAAETLALVRNPAAGRPVAGS